MRRGHKEIARILREVCTILTHVPPTHDIASSRDSIVDNIHIAPYSFTGFCFEEEERHGKDERVGIDRYQRAVSP